MSTGMTALNLSEWQVPVFLCAVGTLILFSIITNVLVVHTIIRTPSLRMLPNCYILSLALCNLLQSVITMPTSAYFNLVGVSSERCKFWIVMESFCLVIFVFSHVAIVINRYFATTCPIYYGNAIRCCIQYNVYVWYQYNIFLHF
jgi:hypothetical protein